jgi:Fur family peroxide stress response transcriptional regulator
MNHESHVRVDEQEMMSIFYEKCKERGLKITPQRVSVYKELIGSTDHPSADVIHKRLTGVYPNISLDTVNRTLITFSEIGIAQVVEGSGEPKRYDQNIDNHHHFRCIRCNRIIDFYNKELDSITIPRDIKRQFNVVKKKVVLEGICDRCSGK